ncbi:hypothetical protein [Amycolatopsis suaedae]|uniref:Uncharacterized protein n=1 Tax=Amycolatopsis suaedae TaxID=2510978 RepID=A0A4Q7J1W8_9PSEU|nr:hypothetical protein [Amycolatopsis suaedae]RZQ60857.1 hypothetical protein EWH70_27550 [Amycolatopsis suaedae]
MAQRSGPGDYDGMALPLLASLRSVDRARRYLAAYTLLDSMISLHSKGLVDVDRLEARRRAVAAVLDEPGR